MGLLMDLPKEHNSLYHDFTDTRFLTHFSPFYLGLVASIGTNSAIGKYRKEA